MTRQEPDGRLRRRDGLPRRHRRWILVNAVGITAVINLVVNGALARLSAGSHPTIPLWAVPTNRPSIAVDTLGTLFLLPLITCVLCTSAVWRDAQSGVLEPLGTAYVLPSFLSRLPETRLRRGLALAWRSTVVLGAPATVLLMVTNFSDIGVTEFVVYKAALGVALGLILTPLIALRAMADDPRSAAS